MQPDDQAWEASRTLMAIVTSHIAEGISMNASLASKITCELDRNQLIAVVAVASVRLAEAWSDDALDMGMEPIEFVQTLALSAAKFEVER